MEDDPPPNSFVAYNAMDEGKWMRVAMPFTFAECKCTAQRLDPACNKYYVGIHYAAMCRHLGIPPNDQIYLSGVVPSPLKVVYPWQDYDACPGETEASYGAKGDHDLVLHPFSWVDHTNPIVYVPVHKSTSERVGFQGCTFYLNTFKSTHNMFL
jgi:hypothetical protein